MAKLANLTFSFEQKHELPRILVHLDLVDHFPRLSSGRSSDHPGLRLSGLNLAREVPGVLRCELLVSSLLSLLPRCRSGLGLLLLTLGLLLLLLDDPNLCAIIALMYIPGKESKC